MISMLARRLLNHILQIATTEALLRSQVMDQEDLLYAQDKTTDESVVLRYQDANDNSNNRSRGSADSVDSARASCFVCITTHSWIQQRKLSGHVWKTSTWRLSSHAPFFPRHSSHS